MHETACVFQTTEHVLVPIVKKKASLREKARLSRQKPGCSGEKKATSQAPREHRPRHLESWTGTNAGNREGGAGVGHTSSSLSEPGLTKHGGGGVPVCYNKDRAVSPARLVRGLAFLCVTTKIGRSCVQWWRKRPVPGRSALSGYKSCRPLRPRVAFWTLSLLRPPANLGCRSGPAHTP